MGESNETSLRTYSDKENWLQIPVVYSNECRLAWRFK